MSKYEMSAMEYLLRYGKDGKRLERKRRVWELVWFGVNLSIIIGIVLVIIRVVR
jgi:hypothetical protein